MNRPNGWIGLALTGITALLLSLPVGARTGALDQSAQAQSFIKRLVSRHGFQEQALRAILAKAKRRQDIIDLMKRPAEGKPWNFYRRIFITDKRIRKGADFWKTHAAAIKEAAGKYQVAPEIIVAIIGIETLYGSNMGKHRVLDALATLAFAYPPRSKFFTSELEQFLLLAREEHVPVTSIKGSYAGAMGYGQFIPSSYRHYAVDGDGDGHRDLLHNPTDAIHSVANYFARHDWRKGAPIAERIDPPIEGVKASSGLKPKLRVRELERMGLHPKLARSKDDKAIVMSLTTDAKDREQWLGYHNFYVITRYNHSHKYAMAAYQLSRAIRARYQAEGGRVR